ncbi:glycoside hydrolase family 3 N-terminal domain-containing protein, partial [Streptomyces ipomoeae]
PRIDADRALLDSRELAPFRAAIAAGSRAIMSAHILVPALDPDLPATLSRGILTDLLRGELGYDGLIVTDGMEMRAVAATYGIEHGSVLALNAGADAICVGGGLADDETVRRLRDALVAAVRSGELPEERLADAADRVRALARWTRSAAEGATTVGVGIGGTRTTGPETANAGGADHDDIGLVAARRALTVTYAELAGPEGYEPPVELLYVAAFTPVANIAVGDETPWGVGVELSRLLPGTETGTFTGDDAGSSALTAAGSRRIVAVVRDEHRHPWMTTALDTLLSARPDTIVVEMGIPQTPPRGALHVATHGAARVCGKAAAEIITGTR